MSASNPRAPTRKQIKAVFGDDKRWIKSIEQLFELIPDEINALIDELKAANDLWIGPALGNLNARVSEIIKRQDQDIQFKLADYTLLNNDSGVVMDTASGNRIVTMPDATNWKNEDKFVQNSGANQVSVELDGTQTVSGVEVLLLPDDTPYTTANMKSDGSNLILLSDRSPGAILGANYWVTDTGSRIVKENGEAIVFVVSNG